MFSLVMITLPNLVNLLLLELPNHRVIVGFEPAMEMTTRIALRFYQIYLMGSLLVYFRAGGGSFGIRLSLQQHLSACCVLNAATSLVRLFRYETANIRAHVTATAHDRSLSIHSIRNEEK